MCSHRAVSQLEFTTQTLADFVGQSQEPIRATAPRAPTRPGFCFAPAKAIVSLSSTDALGRRPRRASARVQRGCSLSFGLVLDLIGFVLLLVVVLVSSIILLTREDPIRGNAPRIS